MQAAILIEISDILRQFVRCHEVITTYNVYTRYSGTYVNSCTDNF